jgi:cytochrome oxidase Cu insertion factor (SCO1/SenC/PrrC family)
MTLSAAAILGVGIGVAFHNRLAGGAAAAQAPALAVPALRGQATWPAGKRPAPAFALHDQQGHRVALTALRGRTVLLMFEDSLCRQACPLEGKMVGAALRRVPSARRPHVVVVSVDPAGDTPHSIALAVRKWHLPAGSSVSWLLGTHARLAAVWHAYGIAVLPVRGDILHSTALYVIDRHGDERAGFLVPFLPPQLAADLSSLGRATPA